jgi:predicted transcriptional regulator
MPDARSAVRDSITRAVNDSGLQVSAIAESMGVRRQTVYQWMGGDIPLDRLGPLADLLGQPIVIRVGDDSRASWPEWARELDAKLDMLTKDETLAAALREARRTAALPTGDEAPPVDPATHGSGQ